MACQTDEILDKPSTPLFIPAKTGKDSVTQIEDGEVQITYSLFVNTVNVFFTLIQ